MTDKPTQTDAELQSIIDDADAGPPTDNEWLCLECGRWTPWRHEEAHDHADGCKAPAIYAARRDWKARLNDYMAKWGIPAGRATAAPAQPAAQLGVAYAEMPTSNYAGRVYEEGFLTGTCPLYTADQMRAFADATHALRVSHGQAPAQAAPQREPVEMPAEIEQMATGRYKVVPSHESMFHRWAVVAGTGAQQLYLGREVECQNMARKFAGAFLDGAFAYHSMTAAPTAQPAPRQEAQEPFAWHVCSVNSDGSLSLEHAAAWEEAAHDHINDAITEQDIEGAGSWVVRPAYHAPQPSPTAQVADSVPAVDESYKQALWSKNCMQCCVSYMLGLPLESVPDFATDGGWELFSEFVESKGYAAVMLPGNSEFEADYLASGTTERGTSHMVVMNDGKLVHDPHPSNAGLVEVQCVWLLAKKSGPKGHQDERAAFEASAKAYTSNVSFERDGTDYADMTASLLWHGWKLRAVLARWGQPAHSGEPVATVIKRGASRDWVSERLGGLPDGVYSLYLAPQPVEREPLTPREIELIDGMIAVQLDHAMRCDAIANRAMADKQKGWDMERVALLQKFKAAHGIKKGGQHGAE